MRSSMSFACMSICRSKWMMPIFFDVHSAMPRTVAKPIEWSPPMITGSAPEEKTWLTPRVIWSSSSRCCPGSRKRRRRRRAHPLAQIDSGLVVVGCVEGRDPPHSLRPESRARPEGGATVERHPHHRCAVLADVADVLDEGRLQEGVDAGEMRLLAPRKRRDRPVLEALGAGQAHVERPLHLAVPAGARQPPFGVHRLPALGLELVVVSAVVPGTIGRWPKPSMACHTAGDATVHSLPPIEFDVPPETRDLLDLQLITRARERREALTQHARIADLEHVMLPISEWTRGLRGVGPEALLAGLGEAQVERRLCGLRCEGLDRPPEPARQDHARYRPHEQQCNRINQVGNEAGARRPVREGRIAK